MLALFLFVAMQVTPSPPVDDEPRRGRVLDLTQIELHGQLVHPSAAWLKTRPKGHRKNLIEMRSNFRPELAKSRDALATSP